MSPTQKLIYQNMKANKATKNWYVKVTTLQPDTIVYTDMALVEQHCRESCPWDVFISVISTISFLQYVVHS